MLKAEKEVVRGLFPFYFGWTLLFCPRQKWQCCPLMQGAGFGLGFSRHVCVSSSFLGAGRDHFVPVPLCTCFPWACVMEEMQCWNTWKLGLILCAWFLSPGKCCLTSCRSCRNAVRGMWVLYMDMFGPNYCKITNCYRCHLWGCEGALGFTGCWDNRPGFSHPPLFWTAGKLQVSFLLACLYLHSQCFAFCSLRSHTAKYLCLNRHLLPVCCFPRKCIFLICRNMCLHWSNCSRFDTELGWILSWSVVTAFVTLFHVPWFYLLGLQKY